MRENSMPICRSIQSHWIYKDAEHFKLWFEMLANARYGIDPKTDTYQGIMYTLNRGEFIFGRISWSERLDIGQQKIRTFIKKLIKENMIEEVSKTNKFTIYYIVNYEIFNPQDNQQLNKENQGFSTDDNQQNNQQITSKQPADNQQITTKEESKEGRKKEKKEKKEIIYSENPLLDEAVKDFIDMRKKIKSPLTDKALTLMLGKLKKLSSDENIQVEILNQSILNNWKGVFALKENKGSVNNEPGSNYKQNTKTGQGKYAGFKPKTIDTAGIDMSDPDIM